MQALQTVLHRTPSALLLFLVSSCSSPAGPSYGPSGAQGTTGASASTSAQASNSGGPGTTVGGTGVGGGTSGTAVGTTETTVTSAATTSVSGVSASVTGTGTGGGAAVGGTATTGQVSENTTSSVTTSTTGTSTPTPSGGCGVPWEPSDLELEDESWRGPAAQVVRREMEVAGVSRRYMVVVPLDYDPNRKYSLIFAFHGLGGDREQLRGYMNMEEPAAGGALVIYPEGLVVQGSDTGWDLNAESDDLTFVDALFEKYTAELCVDEERVFATGHSYGGCMTNSVGCFRGDRFRGIAPVAGCGPFGRATCTGQVAAMIIHSPLDTTTDYASGIQGCSTHLSQNSCDQSPECGCQWVEALGQPDDECVQQAQEPYSTQQVIEVGNDDAGAPELRQYLNCDPGFPVVQIDHYNGRDPRYHNPPAWVPGLVWEFFNQLPDVN